MMGLEFALAAILEFNRSLEAGPETGNYEVRENTDE